MERASPWKPEYVPWSWISVPRYQWVRPYHSSCYHADCLIWPQSIHWKMLRLRTFYHITARLPADHTSLFISWYCTVFKPDLFWRYLVCWRVLSPHVASTVSHRRSASVCTFHLICHVNVNMWAYHTHSHHDTPRYTSWNKFLIKLNSGNVEF